MTQPEPVQKPINQTQIRYCFPILS